MVGNEQVVKRGTVQSLLALLLTFAGGASVFAQPSFSPASPPTLLPDQRIERAQYWFSRRGLAFGVPTDAYGTAVTDRRAIDTSQAGAAVSRVTPPWNFIGPQPMLNALPNLGGAFS